MLKRTEGAFVGSSRLIAIAAACGLLASAVAACGGGEEGAGGAEGGQRVSGTVAVDGSSTVFPLVQAAAEQFQAENPEVRITVGESGTGGGFEKFCAGEIDIANASRPIKSDEEAPLCKKNGVAYSEVQVANDGIAVATNKTLTIDCMTTAQLKQLWNTGSKVQTYNQVDPQLPNQQVSLFGPGTDSGTFDFFTDEINGEEGATRKDYQPSEDDNVLVQGVSGDEGGLGYFGFSYFDQNKDKLNAVGVDAGSGCVKPSTQTIQNGSYKPLSRPLFIYPSQKALAKPQVKAFVDFLMANQQEIATAAQIVPMTEQQATEAKAALQQAEGGGTTTQ
jgi:phosphate transport system substrate-binding protein